MNFLQLTFTSQSKLNAPIPTKNAMSNHVIISKSVPVIKNNVNLKMLNIHATTLPTNPITILAPPIIDDCVIIKFVHFWPEFNYKNNFITQIFQNNDIKYYNSDVYMANSNILKILFIGSFVSNFDDMQKLQNVPSDYVKILYLSEPIEKFYEPCYKLYRNNYFDFVAR